MTTPAAVPAGRTVPDRAGHTPTALAEPAPSIEGARASARRRGRDRGDAFGSVSVELAVFVVPTLMLLTVFVVFCGRAASASIDVHAAAAAGARAAADATTPAQARRAAADAVTAATDGTRWSCSTTVDTSDFRLGGRVAVDVACAIGMGDLALPGIGARTVTATATQPIDPWRATP